MFSLAEGQCDGAHTCQFLEQLAAWLGEEAQPVIVIWDDAPWHPSKNVHVQAQQLSIELLPLPAYSPDLNPVPQGANAFGNGCAKMLPNFTVIPPYRLYYSIVSLSYRENKTKLHI